MSDCTEALPPHAVTILQRNSYIPEEKVLPAGSFDCVDVNVPVVAPQAG